MAMLPDLLKGILNKKTMPSNDSGIEMSPMETESNPSKGRSINAWDFLRDHLSVKDPNVIYNDSGKAVDYDPNGNAFKDLLPFIQKSRANNNTGPSVLRQLLSSVLGGGMVPGTGTVGGDPAGVSGPTHTPGTQQDAALNPTPMKDQSQPNFGQLKTMNDPMLKTMRDPIPKMDYSMPALDPNSIEELRLSLLSDSGQLDPNNPNGLAGRMTDPNSNVDMNNQRKEAMNIEDSVRGFDGSKKAAIQKGNQ